MDVLPVNAGTADPGIRLTSGDSRSAHTAGSGKGGAPDRLAQAGFMDIVEGFAIERGEAFIAARDEVLTAAPFRNDALASLHRFSGAREHNTGGPMTDASASSGPAKLVEAVSPRSSLLHGASGFHASVDATVATTFLESHPSAPLTGMTPDGVLPVIPSASHLPGLVTAAFPSVVPSQSGLASGGVAELLDQAAVAPGEATIEGARRDPADGARVSSYVPKEGANVVADAGTRTLSSANAVDLVLVPRDTAERTDGGFEGLLDPQEQEGVRRSVAPLFGERPAAGQVSAQANAAATQIAARLHALAADTGGAIEIALDPPELGRVRIVMHSSEGIISLSVQAELPQTIDLLRRQADSLLEELRALGYGEANLDFSSSRDWGGEAAGKGAELAIVDGGDDVPGNAPTSNAPIAREVEARGQLDLRM